jgi:hypothetical protein
MTGFLQRLLYLFCLSAVASPAMAVTKDDYQAALDNWSTVLASYVDEQGQIDFISLAKQPGSIQAYIDVIARMSPTSHPGLFTTQAEVLAYHLNAYNALAMWGVIERDIPSGFDSFFKRLRFFKLRTVVLGNESTSLYDYENDVIRALNEPRVHFALNCMVKDCPRLPQQPFQATVLEQQLTDLTQAFFNKDKHLRLDHAQRVVYVSEILDFYTEDFVASGKQQDLLAYINRYRVKKIPADYRVRFIDYDWTINQQP